MKILEKLKMTVESMNATTKNESDGDFSSLFEKYNNIPAEDLNNIILDVKNICLKQNEDANKDVEDDIEEEVLLESEESDTDVKHANKPKDATHTDANKAESMQTNELDASENSYDVDEEPQEMTEEDEDIIVDEEPQEMTEEDEDELIISEEDEDVVVDEEPQEMTEEDEDDFDVYKDELDIVDEEDEDIIVDEEPQEMTEDEDEEELIISEEDEDEDYKNEDNTGAKAAVANRQAKNNFSPDVDDLTKYLDNY